MLQAVAAEVEQLQVFGHQELLGLQVSDAVARQIHLDDVRREPRGDVVQICEKQTRRQNIRSSFCQDHSWENDDMAKMAPPVSPYKRLQKHLEKLKIR